ncbi:MAG: hypothetical protein LBS67_04480, partial [Clostridiales Family XIII bacterium]|nr:hypothetical protein [Clostridiales Family XIII bacterium]
MLKNINKNNLVAKGNDNRIYLFLIIVFIVLAFAYPSFFSSSNIKALTTTCLLPILASVGFTYVMIGGNFDLSIGAVINSGAVICMGEFTRFFKSFGGDSGGVGALLGAWALAFACAIAVGAGIGALNGFLVAKVKVHSFIVTIGMLTAISGFVYTYSKGNTISVKSYALVDVIDKSIIPAPFIEMVTPRFIVVVAIVALFEIILLKTRWGYDLFMVGSNRESAFQAGINTDKKVFMSFVISG